MPALTTRREARERLRNLFERALNQMIPPDETRPLKGTRFMDFEDQVEALGREVLPVVLEEDIVATFARQAEAAPHTSLFTVDLESSVVIPPQGEPVAFDIGAFRRMALLEGLDDLGLARRRSGEILTFRKADRVSRPWVYV